jgi:hypothetical protein
VPSSRTPVTRPAPALPAPDAAASIGVTDTSRKKLVSVQRADSSTSAIGPVIRRPRGVVMVGCWLGWSELKVLML